MNVAPALYRAAPADHSPRLGRKSAIDRAEAHIPSFGRARQALINDQAKTLHNRVRVFSDEHRRLVDIAIQAFSAIKTANVGLTGATGTLLSHSPDELRTLAERGLPETRLAAATTTVAPH